jgi:putative intracellular protease/amidase
MNRNTDRRTLIPPPSLAAWAAVLCLALAACAMAPAPQSGTAARPAAAPEAASRPAETVSDPQAWKRILPPPELPADRPLRAAFLIVDGVYNSELVAPFDVLHHVRFHLGDRPGLDLFTVSPDGGSITSFEGLRLAADYGFADAPAADLLVVPSAEGSMDRDLEDAGLVEWVRRTGGEARWVMSLCDGAFVLARAGLLDGLAATTFPADYDRFAALFPAVDLRVNASFVHDGKVLTSQGGARSYDVALYLVDHLYGEAVARGVAGGLLLPWPPLVEASQPNVHPPFLVVPPPSTGPDEPPPPDAGSGG